MNNKILLTGATGFIGGYVAHELAAAGLHFRALVRGSSDRSGLKDIEDNIEFVEGDLLDFPSLEDAVNSCDTIIHTAALVSFSRKEADRMLEINGTGTGHLINLALAKRVKRFIHLSSVAALDRTADGVISEKNKWHTNEAATAYARSKFAAERHLWRGQAEGLSVAALYPSIVIGAGDWSGQSTPSLFHRAAAGLLAAPSGSSGFVDVKDVAKATRLVLERNIDGDRFLLNAENMSWNAAFALIATSVNAKSPKLIAKPWQTAMVWPLTTLFARLTGGEPALTRDTHLTAQSNYRYDGSKIERKTGFTYSDVRQAIMETGKQYLNN